MERRKRFVLILILGMLSALGPFSIDMYLPGFPAIAAGLNTSVDSISYSLASFFVGICLGQLLCGPLLDRFGRKVPICVGLILYILASVGAALSVSIEMLILFRFLIKRIVNPTNGHTAMIPVMGMALWAFKNPKVAEANAPILI